MEQPNNNSRRRFLKASSMLGLGAALSQGMIGQPKLIHYNKLPKGGHFAAWEQLAFYSEELRESFKSLRNKA